MAHDVGVKVMADEDDGAYDCVTFSYLGSQLSLTDNLEPAYDYNIITSVE